MQPYERVALLEFGRNTEHRLALARTRRIAGQITSALAVLAVGIATYDLAMLTGLSWR